jgi:hypothetical protein
LGSWLAGDEDEEHTTAMQHLFDDKEQHWEALGLSNVWLLLSHLHHTDCEIDRIGINCLLVFPSDRGKP